MPEEVKSFWKTLPGIITAIAGLLTAVTGLLIAFNQTGLLKNDQPAKEIAAVKPAENAPPEHTDLSPVQKAPKAEYDVRFAMEKVKAGEYDYTILGATLEYITPDTRELKIKLRLMNNSNYSQANFWDNGFRLSVDGVPASPTGGLNELVDRHAAKDAEVLFEVPEKAKELIFMIMNGDKVIEIPVELVRR